MVTWYEWINAHPEFNDKANNEEKTEHKSPLPVTDLVVHLVDSMMLDCNDGVCNNSWNFIHELMWALEDRKDRETLAELAKQLILDSDELHADEGIVGISAKSYRLLRKLIAETNCENVVYIEEDDDDTGVNAPDYFPYMEGIRHEDDPYHYYEITRKWHCRGGTSGDLNTVPYGWCDIGLVIKESVWNSAIAACSDSDRNRISILIERTHKDRDGTDLLFFWNDIARKHVAAIEELIDNLDCNDYLFNCFGERDFDSDVKGNYWDNDKLTLACFSLRTKREVLE